MMFSGPRAKEVVRKLPERILEEGMVGERGAGGVD